MHTDWEAWLFLGGLAGYLVGAWWLVERLTARDHAIMIRNLQEMLRSRTPDGSASSPDSSDPQAASGDRAGVERVADTRCVPPAPSTSVGAAVVAPRHAAPTGDREHASRRQEHASRRVTVHG